MERTKVQMWQLVEKNTLGRHLQLAGYADVVVGGD